MSNIFVLREHSDLFCPECILWLSECMMHYHTLGKCLKEALFREQTSILKCWSLRERRATCVQLGNSCIVWRSEWTLEVPFFTLLHLFRGLCDTGKFHIFLLELSGGAGRAGDLEDSAQTLVFV